ncbi:hypothetical protein [Halalkalibaculum sp. DA384]|uniref:hypothetical protein n=1 Tax=Halalkalibaculum sp. DA384 TaxID=3373606 RepID=UPI003754C9ED
MIIAATNMSVFSTQSKPTDDPGFTILFAVIVVGAVTVLGATLAGIYQRSALLVTSSDASSRAFYGADTALECAMYYDTQHDSFSTTTADINFGEVECRGISASDTSYSGSGPYYRSFSLNSDDERLCAEIYIEKETDGDGEIRTRIEARSRNTCGESARYRAERALRTAY